MPAADRPVERVDIVQSEDKVAEEVCPHADPGAAEGLPVAPKERRLDVLRGLPAPPITRILGVGDAPVGETEEFEGPGAEKALADTQVFYKKQLDTSSIELILLNAIGMEKDSIVFYVGIKDLVSEKLGKNKIDNIIDEEKKHIRLLANELTALK